MLQNIQNHFFNKYIPLLIITIVVITFYIACHHFSYNFFYQDDYHLLRFVTVIEDNSIGFQEKIKTLWGLHNEHRIIFPRLITLLYYYIQGHIDWAVLNVVSALYYFGIFFFFLKILQRFGFNYWYVLPVALLIFQPAAFENFYWTISILQQVGNVFWAMFLFYSIVYFNPSKFWISLLLVFILTFTHGNGLFAFGVGGILLFIQKRYKHLSIWIAFMIVVTFIYFYGYYTAQSSNIEGSLSNPVRLIGCFGGFWGIFFKDILNTTNRAILAGLGVFIILFIVNVRLILTYFSQKSPNKFKDYFPERNLFLFACFLYLAITAGLVALSRSWSSIDAAFQNRYLHNSVIGFVLLYCTLLLYRSEKIRKTILYVGLFFGAIYYGFSWYSNYEFLRMQVQTQESDATNYALNGVTAVNDKYFNMNIESILKKSFTDGISIFPKSQLTDVVRNLDKYQSIQQNNFPIEISRDSVLSFNISNSHHRPIFQFTNLNFPYSDKIYLLLKSEKNTFVFATNHRRNRKLNFIKTLQFFTDGFYASIMTDAMPSGEYSVGILQEQKDKIFHYFTTEYKIQNP
jgi:hypothetical protein